MPDFKRSDQQDLNSVYSDTNGFFIAKFMKLQIDNNNNNNKANKNKINIFLFLNILFY